MAKATVIMIDDNEAYQEVVYEHLMADTKWEMADYFIPCNSCGKTVFYITTKDGLCPNCILPDPPAEINLLPRLSYPREWELENGIGYLLFYSSQDGEARRLGVTSTHIFVLNKPFEIDCYPEAFWYFKDNPTVLMNILEEHWKSNDKLNHSLLFDDCQIIAKSGLVK